MSVGKIELKSRGGGYFHHLKPKFSLYEESVYIALKNSVLQYSTKTGLVLAEYQGKKNVVGYDVADINSSEVLVACFEDGNIIGWKTVTHFKSFSKHIQCKNIQSFHLVPSKQEYAVEGIVTYSNGNRMVVALVNFLEDSLNCSDLMNTGDKILIAVSNLRYVVVLDNKKIYFHSLDSSKKSNIIGLGKQIHGKTYTCVECHPNEEIVITGDSNGQVIMWHNIFHKSPVKCIYHWHTLPVNCVAFSTFGSYFYSGGNENVLVRWNWNDSQDKKFLPRMSTNLQQIGVSNKSQLLAISTCDNSIRILDSAFNNISVIQHLIVGDNFEPGIILDPRTKALVMNANVGKIQFYQPKNNTLLYCIDVVGQNQLTNERTFGVENTKVTKFSMSKNSLWMATVEQRSKYQYSHYELRLKFWNFNTSQQTYELNTSIEKPHQESVLSMEFQYSSSDQELKCVTVGADKKFKIWRKTIIQHVNIDRTVWSCYSVGFYRDLPCKSLSFSVDGSLMGIGFGSVLTMWSPDTCELKCSLVYPGFKSSIEFIQFGTCDQCHLVVTATTNRLSVWNLLTLTMIWTVPLEVNFLLANKLSIYMVAITKQNEIYIFSPCSPKPVYSNDELLTGRKLMATAIIPTQSCLDGQSKWFQRMELYVIDSHKEMFSIGIENTDDLSANEDVSGTLSRGLLSKITPLMKNTATAIEKRNHLFKKDLAQKNIKKYLEAPVHTMIPIHFTCSSLIKSFIVQKNLANVDV